MADPFIGRDDLSDKLGEDVTASDYALACVDAACEICRTLAEQTFNQVIGDEIVLDGTGTDALVLPERPVTAAGTVVTGGSTLIEGMDYMLNGRGILLRGTFVDEEGSSFSRVWTRGRQNVAITYDHGYAADDLPRDVRMVALTAAARLYKQGEGIFEQLGDRQIRYAGAPTELSPGEERILAKYRSPGGR